MKNIAIMLFGFLVFGGGVFLFHYVKSCQFNRLNFAGVALFDTYLVMIRKRCFEALVSLVGLFFIVYGFGSILVGGLVFLEVES